MAVSFGPTDLPLMAHRWATSGLLSGTLHPINDSALRKRQFCQYIQCIQNTLSFMNACYCFIVTVNTNLHFMLRFFVQFNAEITNYSAKPVLTPHI